MALVTYLLRHGGVGTVLRSVPFPGQFLEDRACGHRMVCVWPKHGRENRHSRFYYIIVRRARTDSVDTSRGGAAWNADVLRRCTDSAVAYRGDGYCVFVSDGCGNVAELPSASAIPLRSVVGKASFATHAHARDDRNQHFSGGRGNCDWICARSVRSGEHRHYRFYRVRLSPSAAASAW